MLTHAARSPNQAVLTHAARTAAKQLNKMPFRHLWWPRAARAKGSGQSNDLLEEQVQPRAKR